MASAFQILFRATSAVDFYKLVAEMNSFWLRYCTSVAIHLAIFVGDALLVSVLHLLGRLQRLYTDLIRLWQVYRCYMVLSNYRWVTIIPGLLAVAAFGMSFQGSQVQLG